MFVRFDDPINCALSSFIEYAKNLNYDETPDTPCAEDFSEIE